MSNSHRNTVALLTTFVPRSPDVDLQAQFRTHRIGQSTTVSVYHIIIEDSIDVIVHHLANPSLRLYAQPVELGEGEQRLPSEERDEILVSTDLPGSRQHED